jgi:hypothetical protein
MARDTRIASAKVRAGRQTQLDVRILEGPEGPRNESEERRFFYIYFPSARAHVQDCFFSDTACIIGSPRSINPSAYEFISQHSQITIVREFMESLATRLTQ